MTTFLVRRAATAVVLMFGVIVVTFAVFYVVPALGGRTSDQLAAQFASRVPSEGGPPRAPGGALVPRPLPPGGQGGVHQARAGPAPAGARPVLGLPQSPG